MIIVHRAFRHTWEIWGGLRFPVLIVISNEEEKILLDVVTLGFDFCRCKSGTLFYSSIAIWYFSRAYPHKKGEAGQCLAKLIKMLPRAPHGMASSSTNPYPQTLTLIVIQVPILDTSPVLNCQYLAIVFFVFACWACPVGRLMREIPCTCTVHREKEKVRLQILALRILSLYFRLEPSYRGVLLCVQSINCLTGNMLYLLAPSGITVHGPKVVNLIS